ncbi:MAG TPA: NAD(P)H-dependent oxidoreductase [Bryobacteraceae bacterium]|nr:NAD(P)H-dependent oxidoreductase [Bryobacteraceae bacterium]
MKTLLAVDSSPLGTESSVSRQLTAEFVEKWQQAHPDGKVIRRDLITTPLEAVSAEWIAAAHTPEDKLTARQREILGTSGELIAELNAADEYVFGVAMHNFSIPAVLKLWIDQVARAGKTFSYEGGAPAGLLHGKTTTFLVSSGGVYDQGTPMAAMNFVEPYLRSMFRFIGVTDTRFINASGTARLLFGSDRATVLQPARASIHAQFQAA